MKNTTLKSGLLKAAFALAVAGLATIPADSWGQQMVRKYATRQAYETGGIGLTSTSSRPLAVDMDPQTSANMTIGVGVLPIVSLYLDFNPNPAATGTYADMIPAGTPITIKFTAPAGLLSVGAAIQIQAISNLSKNGSDVESNHTNIGTAISGASLIGLLNGQGQKEITITPSAAFQGIRITFDGGLLSAATGTEVFGAYIMEPAVGDINCDDRLDVMSGVTSNDLANLASGVGSVQDPLNVMDGDNTTYAQMNMGVQALNATYINTVFNSVSKLGDKIDIVLQNSTGGLIDVGLLNAFQIKLYNGPILTKTITNDPSLLSLTILGGAGDIYTLSATIDDAVFDRAEVIYGGVLSGLNSMRIYEVTRKAAAPTLTAAEEDIYVYAGQSAALSATPGATGDVVGWFDGIGGATVANPYPTTAVDGGTTIDVFAAAIRTGCNENSEFIAAHIHVIGFGTETPTDGMVSTPYNGSVAIINPTATPTPPDFAYTITSGTLPDGVVMDPATGQLTGTPTTTSTYSFDVTVVDDANGGITVGTFSYVILIDVVLPIEGTELKVAVQNSSVALNWNTLSETNNVGFDIERSQDGKAFRAIGNVATQAIDGNSAQKMAYNFQDNTPLEGANYYRVKQTDKDGKFSYSNVAFVQFKANSNFHVYPNPATDKVTVTGKDMQQVVVYNMLGQRVLTATANGETLVMNTADLAAGNYTLQIISKGNTNTFSLVIGK